jgi:hypothetical protein
LHCYFEEIVSPQHVLCEFDQTSQLGVGGSAVVLCKGLDKFGVTGF